MKRILVVCTANICRSPAAERVLANKLAGSGVTVESAGTQAIAGFSADATIQRLVEEKGFGSLLDHQSKPVMPALTARADLILCMEQRHVQQILAMDPVLVSKVKLYGHWDGQKDVDDPIGRSRETYERSVDEIVRLADVWYEKILKSGLL